MARILWIVDRPLGLRGLELGCDDPCSEPCGVVSAPDGTQAWWGTARFQTYATDRGIPWFDWSVPIGSVLSRTRPDLVLSILFPRILPKDVVAALPCFNLHCAPLPQYGGFNATLWAILNDERRFGSTLHRMVAEVDRGPIVAQSEFEIPDGCSNVDLYRRAHENAYDLLRSTLPSIARGTCKETPQVGSFRFYRMDELPSRELDSSASPVDIARYARAFYFPPFEPASIALNGQRFFVIPASVSPQSA